MILIGAISADRRTRWRTIPGSPPRVANGRSGRAAPKHGRGAARPTSTVRTAAAPGSTTAAPNDRLPCQVVARILSRDRLAARPCRADAPVPLTDATEARTHLIDPVVRANALAASALTHPALLRAGRAARGARRAALPRVAAKGRAVHARASSVCCVGPDARNQ